MKQKKPNASASGGGDGDPRERLIRAGLEVFGDRGFEAATTRGIAKEAAVNLAAIPYYFGGKKELYHAVVDHIADAASELLRPALDGVRAELDAGERDAGRLGELLTRQLTSFLEIVRRPEASRWARIIMREQTQPTEAFSIIYEKVIRPEHETCSLLLARLTGRRPDSRDLILRAHSMLGQTLFFLAGRAAVVRRLGGRQYGKTEIAMIRRIVTEHTEAIVSSLRRSPKA